MWSESDRCPHPELWAQPAGSSFGTGNAGCGRRRKLAIDEQKRELLGAGNLLGGPHDERVRGGLSIAHLVGVHVIGVKNPAAGPDDVSWPNR